MRRSPVPDESWREKSFASVPQERSKRTTRRTPPPEPEAESVPKKRRHRPRRIAITEAITEYRGRPRTKEDKVRTKDAVVLIAEAKRDGRPPDYHEAFCDLAFKMMLLGITKDDLADVLDVNRLTLDNWCAQYPDFLSAIMRGGRVANAQTAYSLYKRANGFEHEAVKIFMPAGAEEPVYAPYMEYHPPDTAAIKMLMVNREPDLWRDRRELTGKDGAPLVSDPKRLRTSELLEVLVLAVPEDELEATETAQGVFEVVE